MLSIVQENSAWVELCVQNGCTSLAKPDTPHPSNLVHFRRAAFLIDVKPNMLKTMATDDALSTEDQTKDLPTEAHS